MTTMMDSLTLVNRIIPVLLLSDGVLVKTKRFKRPSYIGDAVNTVRIFNELEVDEIIFLDIGVTARGERIQYDVLGSVSEQCFMPLAYGGGVRSRDEARRILSMGFEKVVVNTAAHKTPGIIEDLATEFGSQAVVGVIDTKKDWRGQYRVFHTSGRESTKWAPHDWARELCNRGAGELIVTDIGREGMWSGLNLELTRQIVDAVDVPVIAHGGAGGISHIAEAILVGKAHAVGVGSMVVYQKKDMGVLVNFPDQRKLFEAIKSPVTDMTRNYRQ